MSEYIKLNNHWKEVLSVYKKISGVWVEQTDINSCMSQDSIYFYNPEQIDIEITFEISAPNTYQGKSFLVSALYNNHVVNSTWSIISGNEYASINSNGKVTIEEGADNNSITIQATYNNIDATKIISVSYDNQLTIECSDTITGTSGNAIARYNSTIVTPTWTITSGNEYATIDSNGSLTITDSGNVTIEAVYNNYTTTKQISVVYDAGTVSETIVDESGNVTTETTTTSVDPETGNTTITSTAVTINEDGSSSTIASETIENQDGSSSTTSTTTNSDGSSSSTVASVSAPDQNGTVMSSSNTTNYDENGDLTGSSAMSATHNSDGSSNSTTTNYDANGNPTDGSTNNIDTLGNSSTKDIEYDSNGDTTVTAYSIDTSENSTTGTHEISGQEVDTEYYAFDPTHGFELMIHFKFDFSKQTESQATILNAKRSNPEPWYGFDIRRNSSNMQYGVCFYGAHKVNGTSKTTGTTTRNTITKNNDNIYKIKVNYDPTVAEGETTFVMYDMIHNKNIVTSDGKFPDLAELKYIDVIIGCNVDNSGNPQRRAVMEVYDFYVRRTI